MIAEEEYKARHKDTMDRLTVSSTDATGNIISRIYAKSDDWVIYEIDTPHPSYSIKVQIFPEEQSDPNHISENFEKIKDNYVRLKGLIYKPLNKISFKTRMANIISHGLDGNIIEANELFRELINEVSREYDNQFKNRMRYLVTTLSIAILCVVASCITYYFDSFSNKIHLQNLIYIISAGSIGGFLSISRRIRTMVFEKDVKKYWYVLSGIERILIAIFSAIIIYFIIESDIALGIFDDRDNKILGEMVLAVVGGFSETYVPSLLTRIETENT